jgi:hypothetical protein
VPAGKIHEINKIVKDVLLENQRLKVLICDQALEAIVKARDLSVNLRKTSKGHRHNLIESMQVK